MALPLKTLKSTDNLGNNSRCGIQKSWPLKSKVDESLHWDYIQKVNYAVQDFNSCVANKEPLNRENVVFAITLVDWIGAAVRNVLECYREDAVSGFFYTQQYELDSMDKYFRAVRSFVNAHPLETSRHKDYGLDGAYVCIDLRTNSGPFDKLDANQYMLSPIGLKRVSSLREGDAVLFAYSKNDGGTFFHYIGLDLADIRNVASLYINELYELDAYLGGLRKSDFHTR